MRALLAVLLLLAAGLASFPASLAAWERRVLMDESAFVDLGNEVLTKPAVQEALADRIQLEAVGIAVNAGADRTIASSVSAPIVAGLVEELPGSPVANTALVDSHRVLVGVVRDRDVLKVQDGVIILDLRLVVQQVLQVVGAVGLVDPRAVPASAGRIQLVRESDVAFEFRMARLFDEIAPYLIAAPFVLAALGVVVASNRSLALSSAGLVLASCALIRIGLLLGPAASRLRDSALIDANARAAASETYDVLAESFVRQDLIVLAIAAGLFVVGFVLSIVKRAMPGA